MFAAINDSHVGNPQLQAMVVSTSSARVVSIGYVCSTCARRLRLCPVSSTRPRSRRNVTSLAANSVRHEDDSLDSPTRSPTTIPRRSRDYLQLPDNSLAYRWDTVSPTSSQLSYADSFFTAQESKLLWSASKFRTIDFGSLPEVAFLGRSNVGKSSLLNAVLQHKISHTSSKPGRTKTMNAFGVGGEDGRGNDGRLVVLDMPGYGKGSREEWGKEIMKYLVGRKE